MPSSSFDFWKRSDRQDRNSKGGEFSNAEFTNAEFSNAEFTNADLTTAERDRLKFRVFCAISGVDPEGADAAKQLKQLMDRAGLQNQTNDQEKNLEHQRQCLIYGIDPSSSEEELHRARCHYWNVPELLAPDRKSLNHVLKIRYHCQDERR
ncbi:MAG: pentapeptide repeat-containing protein [Cyanobacteria bacterium HKST-UBA02]|nr:pentapeptide repeat-containing protein [Cyanobacteria bacterium HKST-UBA02]